jgi:hypothetical protein
MSYEVPVLLLTFNRPDLVEKQLVLLSQIKPNYLFVFSDGPRQGSNSDFEKVSSCREILNNINWECKIFKKFENKNLGCGKGVSSAISWFFSNIEEGIIIEDDCLLAESFFEFAKNMLDKYRNDISIAGITADYKLSSVNSSYYGFINYPLIWGWATWKRAWDGYSLSFKNIESQKLYSCFPDMPDNQKLYWKNNFKKIYESDNPHTWDYQFSYLVFNRKQKFIHPHTNLVKNIGFNSDATHTKTENEFAFLSLGKITAPYIEKNDEIYNNYLSYEIFINNSYLIKIKKKLKYFFNQYKKFLGF